MSQHDWDLRYVNLVTLVAGWSKDPSTQVGAAVVDSRHRCLSLGFNGIATGVQDSPVGRSLRPHKYLFYEHAERNAIFNVYGSKSLTGTTIYCTHVPCCDCARAIVQTGIGKVKVRHDRPLFKGFIPQYMSSLIMFDEAGVEISIISQHGRYILHPKTPYDTTLF